MAKKRRIKYLIDGEEASVYEVVALIGNHRVTAFDHHWWMLHKGHEVEINGRAISVRD